ncbi:MULTISPECIES: DNA polymerase III subunit alpha [Odoribacter]|uniref:DNA polymerase III subunit alpha n=1 Tax=Odoribacter splanchnicus TaxID=28118 RepID=A0AAW5C5V8_9BACT|nr:MULTISPECIES: DNA polymerase III subunit alpha [Odoribacter]MBV4401176.1 DNA polymerase III subunit alpha [Odoribacter splanchnicus]MBV4409854.1 DNA polymerase III subunit alpha [Odoribacter splanchnicus]MCG4960427.1 DNA polymerase III subunit alpha [Odoribacter splanchnicus]MCG5003523.1 DNA polymerase III subunit alpha [Odoribacter splanchnicus]MDB9243768.1 DNA polymerase III subunit alpha [Odoribacter splanchnicus]
MKFTHFHVHSQYSILDGAASIPGLIEKAKADGQAALALTDHGNMFGIKLFYDTCRQKGIKPILGCEAYVARVSLYNKEKPIDRSGEHLIILAKNLTGYLNLVKLCSTAFCDGFYYRPRIDKTQLEKHHEGLIISSACLGGEIDQKIMAGDLEGAEKAALWYKNLFGEDYYLEVMRHPAADPKQRAEIYDNQQRCIQEKIKIARKLNIKLIATNDVHFLNEEDAEAHDLLICLNTRKDIDDPTRMRYTRQEWFKTTQEMIDLFPDLPEAIENTQEITDKVEEYELDSDPLMPVFPIPPELGTEEEYRQKFSQEDLFNEFTRDEKGNVVLTEEEANKKIKKLGGYDRLYRIKLEADYLKELTMKGVVKRYGENPSPEIMERIIFELHIMKTMGFPGYFLIVQDFIRAARDMGVIVGPGRGSAAGSAVAYCLGITNIDPIKYDLLFERFLNPDRISLPDIDVDFDDAGRQQVLEWVTEKYGADKVSHIVTFGSMAAKMAIKDVARVLKLELSEANRLAKMVPEAPKMTLKKAYKENPDLEKEKQSLNPLISKTIQFAETLEGSIRQTGVHACGILISRDPLTDHIPIMPTEGESLMTTQYDGHFVEPIGLIKMDFLGLRTLSIIKTCLDNIKKSKHIVLNENEIPLDDEETFKLFTRGDTTGLFQFESPGMKKHLRALQPNRFEDLVAMNALYRPGPMEYIPSFIRRKHGEEPIEYDHPMMEPYLKDTYGITVYQEQVMLQSRALGLFTRGQSDTLRKAMGKKKFELLAELKGKFVEGCKNNPDFVQGAKEKGKDVEELVNKIWGDWEAFASYAFNKSHSVCYAYIAYQTGFLKAHYPAEFMAANLSNNLSDITKVTVFMDECKRMGLSVLAPDVNESYNDFTVNSHGQIRFGMAAIKGVGEAAVEKIIEEREKNGPYKDVYDFFERIDYKSVNKKTIENLVTAGGLDSFGYHRAQYLHLVDATTTVLDNLVNYGQKNQQDSMNLQATLFGELDGFEVTKPNIPDCEPWHDYEKSKKEKELIGIYLTSHPLDPYKLEMQLLCTPVEELNSGLETFKGKEINIAGIITAKREGKTKTGKDFGILTLEDFSGTYELAFFGKDYTDFRQYFIDETAIYVKGKVGPKWGKEGNELTFTIQKVGLLEALTENAIRSITLQVDIEKLTLETVTEIHELFTTDVNSESYKEAQQKAAEQKTQKNSDPENFEEPATVQNDIPLNFMLFDRQGNSVKMFSRTCKIRRSRELYEYFENNDSIKMKIN